MFLFSFRSWPCIKHNKWLFLFHRLYNSSKKFRLCDLCLLNVVVPSESKLTVATCNWTRAITQIETTRDGVNGGTLPCVWLAHATSGDSVTKQPHLSPQHHELTDRQHVQDRTRVSVSKRRSKAMKKQQAWGKSLRRLRTQNGLWTIFRAFIWRRSSACKPVGTAVLPNSLA